MTITKLWFIVAAGAPKMSEIPWRGLQSYQTKEQHVALGVVQLWKVPENKNLSGDKWVTLMSLLIVSSTACPLFIFLYSLFFVETFVSSAARGCALMMSFSYENDPITESCTPSPLSATHSTLQSRDDLRGVYSITAQHCTCTVMYGFQLMNWDVQGNFSLVVLTWSVTPHLFLQRWPDLSISLWELRVVEREGRCLFMFSIYQICLLQPGS